MQPVRAAAPLRFGVICQPGMIGLLDFRAEIGQIFPNGSFFDPSDSMGDAVELLFHSLQALLNGTQFVRQQLVADYRHPDADAG